MLLVEVLLYVHRYRRFIRDGSAERPPRLSHSSDNGNRRSSEIQGTALGKSLRAWTCIYRSMPAGVAQCRHAFVGGTVSTWGRWRIPVNKKAEKASEMPIKHLLLAGNVQIG